jgi:hypothetical protein
VTRSSSRHSRGTGTRSGAGNPKRITPAQETESRAGAAGVATMTPLGDGATTAEGDHDPKTGRFVRGNRASLLVGDRSAQFWAAVDAARQAMAAGAITDAGFSLDDAPKTLEIAADSLAQARLIQLSAFERVKAEGGPLTTTNRTRRAYPVWLSATDRVERWVRVLGIKRTPKAAPSLQDYIESRYGRGATTAQETRAESDDAEAGGRDDQAATGNVPSGPSTLTGER